MSSVYNVLPRKKSKNIKVVNPFDSVKMQMKTTLEEGERERERIQASAP